ncbi:MAG: hypothetical protein JWR01_1109 [Subtercola sp.]|nr:hypothetical protein [Subtercola sp.]
MTAPRASDRSVTDDIADNVKRAMGRITRRELGERSGLGKKCVKQVLSANKVATVEELDQIARALETNASDLVGGWSAAKAV